MYRGLVKKQQFKEETSIAAPTEQSNTKVKRTIKKYPTRSFNLNLNPASHRTIVGTNSVPSGLVNVLVRRFFAV